MNVAAASTSARTLSLSVMLESVETDGRSGSWSTSSCSSSSSFVFTTRMAGGAHDEDSEDSDADDVIDADMVEGCHKKNEIEHRPKKSKCVLASERTSTRNEPNSPFTMTIDLCFCLSRQHDVGWKISNLPVVGHKPTNDTKK